MTILGTGFTNATEVDFGTDSANFTVVSDRQITATTPAHADGTVDVTVVTPDGSADIQNGDPENGGFTFLREQTIRTISPTSGPVGGGGTMTITGAGFTGTFLVIFQQFVGGQPRSTRASFTVDSDTQITAVIPRARRSPWHRRDHCGLPSPPDSSVSIPFYNYVTTPTVTGVSGNFGLVTGGTTVTVTGTGFTSGTTVQFGSTQAASVTVHSNTSLSVVSPPGSPGVADITVTNQIGTSAVSLADQFTYLPLPSVTGVSPAVGPTAGRNIVIITGTTFMSPDGNLTATEVDFGAVPALGFFVNSATQITAEAPPGPAGTVDVTVKTSAGTTAATSADQYTYFPVPAVTGVSPSSGAGVGGNTVTLTGTGFTGASAVSFESVPATSFTVNSDTSITATVPAGGVVGVVGIIDDVTVTTPGGTSATSAADHYVYHPTCTTTITGTHATQLTVASGPTCLGNATQSGHVTVAAGAALSVTNSSVNGTVTATSPASITYCGSSENGTLTVTGATGPVTLGGTLTLDNDTAGITLDGSQLNGRAYIDNNAATAPALITVSGNTVTGSLYCIGNNPAPTDNASINTVSGTATDQCAAIVQR